LDVDTTLFDVDGKVVTATKFGTVLMRLARGEWACDCRARVR
jgi:hypothetical protein